MATHEMRFFLLATAAVGSLAATTPRSLYPVGKAVQTGNLAVSPLHTLYYEVHGNLEGAPALFLHGGPGAGCAQRHAGFFDPAHYRVVLFDQRGCGRSTPKGCLEGNDTPSLVADCEALREHLGVDDWSVVLGGSWGTTLALAYACAHPKRIDALVLRAICLMRSKEVLWLFGDRGVARLLPEGWHAYAAARTAARDKQQRRQQLQPAGQPRRPAAACGRRTGAASWRGSDGDGGGCGGR